MVTHSNTSISCVYLSVVSLVLLSANPRWINLYGRYIPIPIIIHKVVNSYSSIPITVNSVTCVILYVCVCLCINVIFILSSPQDGCYHQLMIGSTNTSQPVNRVDVAGYTLQIIGSINLQSLGDVIVSVGYTLQIIGSTNFGHPLLRKG